ncbi:MAG: hypothetical protein NPINA01_08060 [Nitrospinaceae bacterium]|nr:MAG: hypothetical protein NPINA01_08060 [Nitrospinaceae bacterium]
MLVRIFRFFLIAAVVLASSTVWAMDFGSGSKWQEEFDIKSCNLQTTGRNNYFILEPGYQIVLEGDDTKVQITVLDKTKTVDGVVTRVVEEREWVDGELYEVAMNYFAICEQTKDVFYFGEDVDFYEKGKIVKHDGAWLAGVNGNKAGLIMSGSPKVGMKYYQEIAPDVAMDRGEIISLNETCKTPAGTFSNCMKIKEGTSLNVLETEYKFYAPGIGLIQDEDLLLTKHGKV